MTTTTVRELSEAVADVNDWRALGLFAFAFMGVLLAMVVWLVVSLVRANKPVIDTVIPVRIAMEAAKDAIVAMKGTLDSLVGQISRLTSEVGRNGEEAREAIRKVDALTQKVADMEDKLP
ncbi:MAG: hypothetical protein WA908_01435 [Pontixanthobacter sp.]